MSGPGAGWEQRNADLWAAIEEHDEEEFLARMESLVAELPTGSAIGAFERAGAGLDRPLRSGGTALPRGSADRLTGVRRRRAVIQLASSLRNLGNPQEAVALLAAELEQESVSSLRNLGNPQEAVALLAAELEQESDDLAGAVRGFLALALVDVGREREAVAYALTALADYLPRYNRSLANYARLLTANAGAQAKPNRRD